MNDVSDLKKRIELIEIRNRKVEADKSWETSNIRKIIITLLTYIVVLSFFLAASLPNPFVNSLVPTLGYFLSTLSIRFVKNIWLKRNK